VKAVRIVQLVLLVLLAVYLWIFHSVNEMTVTLPLLPSMRPGAVVVIAIVLTYLVGWVPGRYRVWRLERKLEALRAERDELATRVRPREYDTPPAPVIPDRAERSEPGGASTRRGDDPSDYL
jgi:membrane protein YdbS with pleckstrin-like domain